MTASRSAPNATLPRLSHVVRRLEDRGLVDGSRARRTGARRTRGSPTQGWEAVVAAAPGHVANVRSHVIDALSPAQVGQLDVIVSSLLERLDPDGHMSTTSRTRGKSSDCDVPIRSPARGEEDCANSRHRCGMSEVAGADRGGEDARASS